MQKPFFKGQSTGVAGLSGLNKSPVSVAMRNAAAAAISQATFSARPSIEHLERRELLSATYFVSTSGSDTNSGSLAAPFASIQRAATIASPGDVVEIEGGTYHETVTVNRSGTPGNPIVFTAYNNEKVTVSGADPVTGWSQTSANIYNAPMSWDLGEGNNEVFVNGQEINEARFPNTSLDPSNPTTEIMQSVHAGLTSATIYDSNLTQPADYWKGAVIHMDPGQAWVDQIGVVTASAPGSITVSYAAPSSNIVKYSLPQAGNAFYLVGKFQSLDTAGEWYRDPSSGQLYVWTPSSNDPNADDVEVKARQYAFDLGSAQNVTIQGINIFAATIRTTANSRNIVIDGITAEYISQFFSLSNGWSVSPTSGRGIMLMGTGDVLENSTIAYATGDGVVTGAPGVVVDNNVIHDVDTIGGDMSGIRVFASGATIENNTVYNTGRDGIEASVSNVQILHNVVHDVGLQTTEPGGIYTVGTKGNNAVIAYNDVYNIHTGGFGGTGIFLDNGTSYWNVYNNIVDNVDYAMKFNFISLDNNIYNNTLSGELGSLGGSSYGSLSGTQFVNNVLIGPIITSPGAVFRSNTRSYMPGVGAGPFTAGASGVAVITLPPVVTPPVTPPVTTPPVITPPVITPPATAPPVSTPPVTPPGASVPLATKILDASDHIDSYNVGSDGWGGVGAAHNNGFVAYKLDFGTGVTKISGRLASVQDGGQIEVRLGSSTGVLLGTIQVANTQKWSRDTTQSAALKEIKGVQTVYLVFKGKNAVANIDSLTFS